ncbi:D-alanyl-D-alanine carboxypeptidase/D-alanyl-D-alanine-endopeptidase [Chitinophaga pendula]|uniref:D-alanyl-D-alanine carboxypeptidase/D-alanyl-D-alanine endopeptidase n=1 Tax=Chitinophaga TaxID=79328 RepID=UPI000BAFB069|nr:MULTISPECIES: D-alanyl-D-alanine carboxypeptidase/D-alanyl-D-alanine-endopeptidase [Chitinophaga]ASZ11783.1 D-alanyl-D-alanine carboxypeptidase/D-alanyl-D-alanine-endopeptidase [Chitinophaga sp. MD30]UCJ05196.1 D-alanyl-D-alanine carboxypeptidase/D-alanyl-D-alanine-endopeptidase [Chitinophaga pendula]
MIQRILASVCLLGITSALHAQNTAQQLQSALSTLTKDPQLKYASWSMTVINAQTGTRIFEDRSQQALAPGSVLKIITATTALSLLGSNYQYKTTVAYDGNIHTNGTLQGNIIIKGAGDPSLGSPRYQQNKDNVVLQDWVDAIKKTGIKKINGKIIADDAAFDTQTVPDGWIWQDLGNYYGAGASGLSWRENQFDILLQPSSRTGAPVAYKGTRPEMPYLTIINELLTGPAGSGDQAYAYLPPYTNTAYLRGTLGLDEKNTSIAAAIPDPGYECAYRLQEALRQANITTAGITTARLLHATGQSLPARTSNITTTNSPSLDKIIYWFLKKSINLYGEHLLKTLALQQTEAASTTAGITRIKQYWQQAGIDSNALNIFDGSGLAPANRITTSALTNVLFRAQKESWFPIFYDALPEINNMKMKDGYINNVRAYAGYTKPKQGPPLIFALIVNNFNGTPGTVRQKMWKVLDTLK